MLHQQLEQLARIREPAARSELIRALVAEYARSTEVDPSPTERALFSGIVLSVFEELDRAARYELVVRLAKTDRITSDLADRLAEEEYALSEPVLEHSPVISEDALKNIARTASNQHRKSIARRTDLTEEICDTLIARGSRPITLLLLDNLSTPLSVKACLALLIFANTEENVLAALAKRALLDEGFHETLSMVLESGCPLFPPVLEKALKANDLEKLAARAGNVDRDADIEIDGEFYSRHEAHIHIANGELTFDSILRTLIDDERMDAVGWLLARQLQLRDEAVMDTIKSDADIAIMKLMIKTGVGTETYRAFLQARCVWLERSTRAIPDLIFKYKSELRKVGAQAVS